ncbi:MAG TPA: flagellar motor switch protein FliM [Bacillota bacterium]|nr:flagellar motor switch protein FliM [Bacillota bacterium]HOB86515.1 flagellar motor switch protein FliM [Bacillota bacterium]HOP68892.1 flagellar motor switch protein FliM [Bacillota bacterium]HPT33399.1 flagellar motor switch protein FliM [Bacillota bacterium]HQD05349.1 flagellar motor switch protein FliM [Bacillota bacterium]
MAEDILSQEEIDALITTFSAGDAVSIREDKADYQLYDFRRPTKFTKEQLRTLQIIHENYARVMSNFLTAYLRVPVKVAVVSVSQVTYEEFIFSLPVPTLLTVFNMAPDMGNAILETNPQFVFTLIDLIFGGEGKSSPKVRELTEIELTVMQEVHGKLLDNLSYVWKGVTQLQPKIESMETNPQFSQGISSSETVAQVTLSVQIQGNKRFINFCFPFITLERVLSSLTAQHWFSQVQKASSRKPSPEALIGCLAQVEVEVKVVLGSAPLSLEDFLQIQEGDVIQLNRKEGEPMEILVEDMPLFQGQPGVHGCYLAVQITDTISEQKGAGEI